MSRSYPGSALPTRNVRTDPASTAGGCTATYRVINRWQGGFQVEVTVRNISNRTTDGWSVGWAFTSGVTVANHWNAELTSSGTMVTARSVAWNGRLQHGDSTVIGFIGSGDFPDANSPACTPR
ncbi:cellulose binding domain-containing protein [Micromonospora sp. CPCC 206060]|uniref:cellulose binding domain-containing protein n=1 Tax=Micromonospora sp. CPCC 206060 TaxID=3122406 RepID=UPI002FF1EDFB